LTSNSTKNPWASPSAALSASAVTWHDQARRAGQPFFCPISEQVARDLVLQLDHAKIPFSLIVVDRHPQVVQEPRHLHPMAVQP
jgi:hypothetical protein